ncbi:MAG: hypothetical protein J2P43_06850 [Candidatus Dormibacteraeota bacterium]|nr:hypothetical protein [Candidatus Dormibacteraeota bacterium]
MNSVTEIGRGAPGPDQLAAAREPNQGASCTTAAILTVLRAMGARELPDLARATVGLGAAGPYGPPPVRAYLRWPWRRAAPLDRAVEALAARCGLRVRCRTSLRAPWPAPRPGPGSCLVANLAYGQERPGVRGTWGWNPLRPRTYASGGHSVVIAGVGERGERLVVDPNWPGLQRWRRPGWSITVTRIWPG